MMSSSSSCVLGCSQSSIKTPPPSLTHKKAATPPRAFLRVGFNNPTTTSISVTTTTTTTGTGVGSETRRRRVGPLRCVSALTPELKTTLDTVVTSQKVVLFMKGTKDFPQCGFSHTVVQILKSLNVPFETINILENDMLRQGLKEYSSWPTFPQLYIDGEFFGGCDIAVEAYKSGELQELLEKAFCS